MHWLSVRFYEMGDGWNGNTAFKGGAAVLLDGWTCEPRGEERHVAQRGYDLQAQMEVTCIPQQTSYLSIVYIRTFTIYTAQYSIQKFG